MEELYRIIVRVPTSPETDFKLRIVQVLNVLADHLVEELRND